LQATVEREKAETKAEWQSQIGNQRLPAVLCGGICN